MNKVQNSHYIDYLIYMLIPSTLVSLPAMNKKKRGGLACCLAVSINPIIRSVSKEGGRYEYYVHTCRNGRLICTIHAVVMMTLGHTSKLYFF